jgi:hypothetical protein
MIFKSYQELLDFTEKEIADKGKTDPSRYNFSMPLNVAGSAHPPSHSWNVARRS